MSNDDQKKEQPPKDLKRTSVEASYISEIYRYSKNKHFIGEGTKEDIKKAQGLFTEATQRGSPKALNKLGHCYRYGTGVQKDLPAAARCYRLVAKTLLHSVTPEGIPPSYRPQLNRVNALCNAGEAFEQEKTFEVAVRSYNLAVASANALHYMLAAEPGNADYQYKLGAYYEHGMGVEKDENEAARLYSLAAKQGNENAVKKLNSSVTGYRDVFFYIAETNTALGIRPVNEIILDYVDLEWELFKKFHTQKLKPILDRYDSNLYIWRPTGKITTQFLKQILSELETAIDCYLEDKEPTITPKYLHLPKRITLDVIRQNLLQMQDWDAIREGAPEISTEFKSLLDYLKGNVSIGKDFDHALKQDAAEVFDQLKSFLESLPQTSPHSDQKPVAPNSPDLSSLKEKDEDINEAQLLITFASKTEDPGTLKELGHCYKHGTGVQQNLPAAAECYRLVVKKLLYSIAREGIPLSFLPQLNKVEALYDAGAAYEEKKRFVEAMHRHSSAIECADALYYMIAAERGNAHYQYQLGYCYEHGIGVEKDENEAKRLYSLAATQGNKTNPTDLLPTAKQLADLLSIVAPHTSSPLHNKGKPVIPSVSNTTAPPENRESEFRPPS